MFDLLLTMLERLGIIVSIAFVLTRFRFFRDMVYHDKLHKKQQITAILFFGAFGILGTYTGLTFSTETTQFDKGVLDMTNEEAIANSRVIGIVVAGLLGGYKVGVGAGLVAGIHRFTLGGFTAISCGIAAIVTGIIAGAFYRRKKRVTLPVGFVIGALTEAVQMLIILFMAKPFEQALDLVEVIGIPMIIANGIGSALFLLVIKNVIHEEEKSAAVQAQKTLRIVDKTLSFLRKGIHQKSAYAVCQILYKEIEPAAVSITNTTHILAHVGLAADHHQANMPLQTSITKKVIKDGKVVVADDKTIHCIQGNCPLGAAVIAPLKQRGDTIGTLKFYFKSERDITDVIIETISGLSILLSNQLEIAEADRAYQVAKETEIKALQAQISPHFLFNSLNIIVSLIRTEPSKARKLLVSLSHFLRQNLTGTTHDMITIEQEMKHVQAYLAIEEARFVDKLKVFYNIEENLLTEFIPPLTLQPIVENAIKHGIKDRDHDCTVKISILERDKQVLVKVEDNGKGIRPEHLEDLGKKKVDSEEGTGLGLFNVNRRLEMMFGVDSGLKFESAPIKGTEISFIIPRNWRKSDG
jgi:two-component system, LytTR family, sensor histidine kinase LytS